MVEFWSTNREQYLYNRTDKVLFVQPGQSIDSLSLPPLPYPLVHYYGYQDHITESMESSG